MRDEAGHQAYKPDKSSDGRLLQRAFSMLPKVDYFEYNRAVKMSDRATRHPGLKSKSNESFYLLSFDDTTYQSWKGSTENLGEYLELTEAEFHRCAAQLLEPSEPQNA